ncbi:MAG: hypothetical protein ABIS23_05875 [Sphingomicrobium sp.]
MSLLTLIIAASAFPAAAANQAHGPSPLDAKSATCPRTASVHALDRNRKPVPRKLTELPRANAYSAVLHTVEGCEVPIVVRYGVGGR